MRIVGGRLSGRRFGGPPTDRTRPTSERVREALASALDARGRFEGARVLDLYAGTGALAFEALSRGARHATLVERDAATVAELKKSIASLGLGAEAEVVRLDLSRAGVGARLVGAFDLVFVDPPYADVDAVPPRLAELRASGHLSDDALVVLEHDKRRPPADLGEFASIARYEYGDTLISFLAARPADP